MRRTIYGGILAALVFGLGGGARAATDDFDDDPLDNPIWELHEPVPGATYSVEDGWWRVTIPAGINFDTWTAVDNGPQLRRDDMPEVVGYASVVVR